jgi:hypothetical protein
VREFLRSVGLVDKIDHFEAVRSNSCMLLCTVPY